MNKKLLRKKLALMLANLKKPRKYYTEVEYLKSTGTQWLDLNFIPDNNSGFDITGDFVQTSAAVRFGQRTAAYNRQFMIITGAENRVRLDYGTGPAYSTQWSPTNTGGYNRITLDGTTKTARVYFNNGTTEENTFTTGNFTAANSCYLFAFNNNGTALIANNMTVKTFKLYDNGTLIRDMIPVLDWDMTPCMYDRVTGQLFYNAGTGDFVAGRQIHPVEYLEADGNQFIKTGIVPNNSTGAYCVFNLNNMTTNNYLLGSRGSQAGVGRFYLYNNENSTNVRYGWDSINTTNADAIIGTKVSVSLNYKNDKKYIYNNSILVQNLADVSWSSNTYQMYLFSANFAGNDGTSIRSGINGKIYEAQITRGIEIIRDYIPVKDENNVGYMFDKVTHSLYANAGTGSFVVGRVKEEEYE